MKWKKVAGILSIILVSLLVLFLSLMLAFNIVYIKTKVDGRSMFPNLNNEDRVFINKFEDGNRGDIVVVDISNQENWEDKGEGGFVVKRLVGKAGDKIKMVKTDNSIYELVINDKVISKQTIYGSSLSYEAFVEYVDLNIANTERIQDGCILVKSGEVFIMGDNWSNSYDCTTCGPISAKAIVGRVDIVVPKSQNLFWGVFKGIFIQIF